jgi:hypothetical protein
MFLESPHGQDGVAWFKPRTQRVGVPKGLKYIDRVILFGAVVKPGNPCRGKILYRVSSHSIDG